MEKDWVGFAKIRNWCALRERSAADVRRKLFALKSDLQLSAVLDRLHEEDFLNEPRFAEDFARGKLRIKRWGPAKIKAALLANHSLDSSAAQAAVDTLEPDDLREAVDAALAARRRVRPGHEPEQLIRHVCQRGFAYAEARDAVARSTFTSPC
ncbi:MAG: RecX family transcriptional regulator [Flavobacteriales bacterium]|jgi:regulatory protein|nr:RecX family transcriptional regulator [Flavobacteriales bacterium]